LIAFLEPAYVAGGSHDSVARIKPPGGQTQAILTTFFNNI